ncbi:interleukin 17a/f1 [Astyanax mexicanus]|uniref:Interleukin 17F n=2 Tax=Astyanax mexicanus TaxID=7994 RepID=A0A3B1JSW7_ASTMX|nr:interleukin 17a/f1 [Astyanax mexicanus]KAG9268972.1 interleukin-17F-like [Astyanax mexicanus]
MRSAMKFALMMAVCVVALAGLRVQGASLKKNSGPHKEPSHCLVLDQQIKGSAASIRPINNDSISPWEYTYTEDPDLYPSVISSARCLLTGCLNVSGDEVLDVESKPIERQILVLRRVKTSKTDFHFKLEYKTITVGCTCVRPHVQNI